MHIGRKPPHGTLMIAKTIPYGNRARCCRKDAAGVSPDRALGNQSMSLKEPDSSESSDGVVCAWDGCDSSFTSTRGMKIHHKRAHGVSIKGVEVDCAWCGKTRRETRATVERCERHFCDDECRGNWQSENNAGADSTRWVERVKVFCAWCGEPEAVRPKEAENKKHHFCDRGCQGSWQAKNRTGENHPSWDGGDVAVSCSWCGSEKQIEAHEYKAYNNHFCDRKCKGEWRSENKVGENNPAWSRSTVCCSWCGEEKEVARHEQRRSERHFCDWSCQGEWLSKNQTGEDAPAWKGGHATYGPGWNDPLKEKVRERQNRRCAGCGKHERENYRRLPVHHIRKARSFDDPQLRNDDSNLVALCDDCHPVWEQMSPLRPQTPYSD